MRCRSADVSSLSARMYGIGFDSGFYSGGYFLFFQWGTRCWGVWWGD